MARPTRSARKPCPTCPKGKEVTKAESAKRSGHATALDPSLVTAESECTKLWRHVLFGTTTCVIMLEGYTDLNMPGNPIAELETLVQRLQRLATIHKDRRNASKPAKR